MERQQPNKRSRADKGMGRMILLSLVVHLGAIAAVVMAGSQRRLEPMVPQVHTVSLIDPAALGGGLPLGPGKGMGQPAKAPDKSAPAASPKPQSEEKRQETTAPNPPPVKDKPVETVKASPPAPPKPEPKKELVKLPAKEKQKKEKKPQPKKAEKKEKPKPQAEKKIVKKSASPKKKPEKKVASKQPESPKKKPSRKKDTPVKKPTPQPKSKKIAKKAKQSVSTQERDEQRLTAALDRIRKNVERKTRQSGQVGAGQHGRGGGSSGGGGGGVQGLAFMMYTQEVKQRVKESWIVTQKKSGLTAVVQFGVRPSGDIVGVELAQSSGNNAFDQSVLRAVHHANPLPPPPREYQQEFLSQKVKVAFGK